MNTKWPLSGPVSVQCLPNHLLPLIVSGIHYTCVSYPLASYTYNRPRQSLHGGQVNGSNLSHPGETDPDNIDINCLYTYMFVLAEDYVLNNRLNVHSDIFNEYIWD